MLHWLNKRSVKFIQDLNPNQFERFPGLMS